MAFDLKSLQNFDWRSLQKYASPKASEDLNTFLEKMPQNTSQIMLGIAGIVWCAAGAAGLYATVQTQKLTEMSAELQEAQAIQPAVPSIRDVPVDSKAVEEFIKRVDKVYRDVKVSASGANITITSASTASFGQFREVIGHVQNGGSGWRVNVDKLCVGRECRGGPLSATLKINKVSVDKPR